MAHSFNFKLDNPSRLVVNEFNVTLVNDIISFNIKFGQFNQYKNIDES